MGSMRFDNGDFADVRREGQLHQNAVDIRVGIQLLDQRQDLALGGRQAGRSRAT